MGAYQSLLPVLDCPFVPVHVCIRALTNTCAASYKTDIAVPDGTKFAINQLQSEHEMESKILLTRNTGPVFWGEQSSGIKEPGTEENNAGYMQSHSCGCDQAEANE